MRSFPSGVVGASVAYPLCRQWGQTALANVFRGQNMQSAVRDSAPLKGLPSPCHVYTIRPDSPLAERNQPEQTEYSNAFGNGSGGRLGTGIPVAFALAALSRAWVRKTKGDVSTSWPRHCDPFSLLQLLHRRGSRIGYSDLRLLIAPLPGFLCGPGFGPPLQHLYRRSHRSRPRHPLRPKPIEQPEESPSEDEILTGIRRRYRRGGNAEGGF